MDALFLQILNMSITASYAILAVIIIRLLLKKAPKSISYALWAVVLFRLICPFSFESVLSILPSANPLPQEILISQAPMINSGIPIIDHSVTLPAPLVGDSVNPMQVWAFMGMILWIIGVLVLVSYSVISYLLLKRRVRTAILLEDNIFECDAISSPFVLGLIKPKIYLPIGLNKEQKAYILKHEQFHIKRKDNIIKLFSFLVLCMHWFNPLVWISFILMTKDMEMSCDEAVLKQMGSDIKQDYSLSLLSLAVSHKMPNGSPLAFGESNIKSRIKNVLNYKKPAFWVIVVAIAAIIFVCVVLMANPNEQYSFDNPIYKDKKQPVAMADFLLAENPITLANGETVKLQVVMTDGQYYNAEQAGYGGGTYDENYNGTYEFRILSNNKVVSTQKMRSYTGEQKYNFSGHFDVLFSDYNNDGDPDFSIGQWGGSTANEHTIYTIDKNKKIKIIGSIYTSEGKYNSDFSYKFKTQDEKTITTEFYDNGIGENRSLYFQWDEKDDLFKEATAVNPVASPEDFIQYIFDSMIITDGIAELTIPEEMPKSFVISDLSISFTVFYPYQDGYTPSDHLFYDEENNNKWALGKSYKMPLTEKIVDGTEISKRVSLVKNNIDVASVYSNKTYPLRDDTFAPSVSAKNENGKGEIIFSDRFNDKFNVALDIPDNWVLKENTETHTPAIQVDIFAGDTAIGTMFYEGFKLYPDTTEENYHRSVYSGLMLGSVASWDNEYKIISKTDTVYIETCKPFIRASNGGLDPKEVYSKGILSHDRNLLKYIAINLNDNAVTDAEWLSIAKSVKLSN